MAQTSPIEAIPLTLEFKSPRPELAGYATQSDPTTASEYFAQKFPVPTRLYGPAVLEAVTYSFNNKKQSKAVYLNEDWAAGVLGSNPRLGHHVVYYTSEGTFWFYDAAVDCYRSTTEEKLMLYLSQILIHAAKELSGKIDVGPLVVAMRDESKLRLIIKKAKALLAADESFFEGSTGYKRLIGTTINDPTQEPSYKLFVKDTVQVSEPTVIITVGQMYELFLAYCKERQLEPVAKHSFGRCASGAVREEFGVVLRRDLKDQNGKYIVGWKGLNCRMAIFNN